MAKENYHYGLMQVIKQKRVIEGFDLSELMKLAKIKKLDTVIRGLRLLEKLGFIYWSTDIGVIIDITNESNTGVFLQLQKQAIEEKIKHAKTTLEDLEGELKYNDYLIAQHNAIPRDR